MSSYTTRNVTRLCSMETSPDVIVHTKECDMETSPDVTLQNYECEMETSPDATSQEGGECGGGCGSAVEVPYDIMEKPHIPTFEEIYQHPLHHFKILMLYFAICLKSSSHFKNTTADTSPDEPESWSKMASMEGDGQWNYIYLTTICKFATFQKRSDRCPSYSDWVSKRKSIGVSNKLMKVLCQFIYSHYPGFPPQWKDEHEWGTVFEAFFYLFYTSLTTRPYADALVKSVVALLLSRSEKLNADELKAHFDSFVQLLEREQKKTPLI